jgi:hypothetical protein
MALRPRQVPYGNLNPPIVGLWMARSVLGPPAVDLHMEVRDFVTPLFGKLILARPAPARSQRDLYRNKRGAPTKRVHVL